MKICAPICSATDRSAVTGKWNPIAGQRILPAAGSLVGALFGWRFPGSPHRYMPCSSAASFSQIASAIVGGGAEPVVAQRADEIDHRWFVVSGEILKSQILR